MDARRALTLALLVCEFEIQSAQTDKTRRTWADELRQAHNLLSRLRDNFERKNCMITPSTNESQLLAARELWSDKRALAAAEIEALESRLGQAILNGTDGQARAELKAAQSAMRDAEIALAEIDRLLPPARASELRRRAADNREQANRLEKEAEQIEQQVSTLLDKIQELEGCRYVPPGPISLYSGPAAKSGQLREQSFRLNEHAANLELDADDVLAKAQKVSIPQWPV